MGKELRPCDCSHLLPFCGKKRRFHIKKNFEFPQRVGDYGEYLVVTRVAAL
jgi:hypothetical protein